jgi:hypothetical protein
MRQIDANTLNALSGSRSGDKLTVYAWYDGRLSYPDPLPVSQYSLSWDATRQVQQLRLVVADKDGKLAPWLLEDPLGAGGARLQVRYDVGGAGFVNLGWYRIAVPEPSERWQSYVIDELGRVNPDSEIPDGKRLTIVSGGATVQLTAYDLAHVIKKAELLAPESPKGGSPTILSEIRRLVDGIVPVATVAGVVDRAVNSSLIYEEQRLDAVQDLCKRISCDYRLNGDGQLEVYPLAPQAPVAVLQGGPGGLLVKVDRAQNIDELYNQFVADGATSGGTPVRGLAQITSGPLRVYGPNWLVPKKYSSTMIRSQDEATAYALEMMQTHLAGLMVELKVTCLPLPHIQQGDWVQVGSPVVNGQIASLVGRVTGVSLSGNRTAPDPMTVTVQCSYSDVQNVIGGIDRG